MKEKRQASLFFDESGNTGTNWLDQNQPYYVYGGWLVLEDKREQAESGIKKIFHDSKAKELKSSYILEKKRPQFKQFMDFLLSEIAAIPVFGIADKKYMIAAKIVETFFDKEYNPNVNGYLTYKSDLKKALADTISANRAILEKFIHLMKQGTISMIEMRKIHVMLADHFKNLGHEDVFEALINLKDSHLGEMIAEFELLSKDGSEKKWLSLTYPILFDRLYAMDQFAAACDLQVHIQVDELFGFQPVLDQIKTMFGTDEKPAFFQSFCSIEACKSDQELLIQAADLLCGFVSRSFIAIEEAQKDTKTNEIWSALIKLRDIFSKKGIIIWDYYAHDHFIKNFALLAGFGERKYKDESHKIITRDFPLALR